MDVNHLLILYPVMKSGSMTISGNSGHSDVICQGSNFYSTCAAKYYFVLRYSHMHSKNPHHTKKKKNLDMLSKYRRIEE
jgi:hypothetical protein